jgi:ribosomal RNA-processing protein 12
MQHCQIADLRSRFLLQVNKKTRTAAYQLIVDIAHELDEARPLSVNLGGDDSDADVSSDDMDYGDDVKASSKRGGKPAPKPASGGLLDFVNAVMGGLVGSSPHMQSAAVLALARLSFEFAGQLESVVGRLLPAVLLLLRSQSREVIKAVLGFIKVGAFVMSQSAGLSVELP